MTTDYEAAGIPLDRPGVRIERLAEALAVLRGLWSDEPCTVAGDHYRVDARSTASRSRSPRAARRSSSAAEVDGSSRWPVGEADVVGINVNLAAGVIDRHRN